MLSKLFLFLFISFIYADVMATEIEVFYVKGKAFVENEAGDVSDIKNKMKLLEMSKITTGADGLVILKINKHSTHKIEQETEVVIQQLPYFYENSIEIEQPSVIELIYGVILSEIQTKADTETFKVTSGKTSFGVRGTRFLVSKDKDDNLLASVDEGIVQVSGPEAKQVDYLEKDESIEVLNNKTFQKRQKYKFQKKINWNLLSRDRKKNFKALRGEIKEEISKRRQKWIKNTGRVEDFKAKWIKKKEAWRKRTRKLAPSKKLRQRKEKLSKIKKRKIRKNRNNRFLKNEKKELLKERFQNRRKDINSRSKVKKSNLGKKIRKRRRESRK